MPGILIDVTIEGQAAHVWRRLQSAEWRELTAALDVRFLTFRDVSLDTATADEAVWRICQANGYYLLRHAYLP